MRLWLADMNKRLWCHSEPVYALNEFSDNWTSFLNTQYVNADLVVSVCLLHVCISHFSHTRENVETTGGPLLKKATKFTAEWVEVQRQTNGEEEERRVCQVNWYQMKVKPPLELIVPLLCLSTIDDCSFLVVAAKSWNSLLITSSKPLLVILEKI